MGYKDILGFGKSIKKSVEKEWKHGKYFLKMFKLKQKQKQNKQKRCAFVYKNSSIFAHIKMVYWM